MKKIILVALIAVMLTTPCFAQEVEPEGIFSVDGTLWGQCEIVFNTTWGPFFSMNCDKELGFYQGKVYGCKYYEDYFCAVIASYVDLGVVSIAWDIYPWNYYLAIMQSTIGFGAFTWGYRECGSHGGVPVCAFGYSIGIICKINDNWIPPGIE
jgi:hypothetical protein